MATEELMDVDMDIVVDADIDINNNDLDDDEIARMQAEINEIHSLKRPAPAADDTDAMLGIEALAEEGEIDKNDLVANKVHVRGVNDLTTRDVENFAADLFPSDDFSKIEWIDDTSVNLVYNTGDAARKALQAFTAEDAAAVEDPLDLRKAKPLATHPHVELFVRMAVESDRKQRGAARQSEFYRQNPQIAKRRRFNDAERNSRGRSASSAAHVNYDRNDLSRRGPPPEAEFSADLYDDNPAATASKSSRDLFADRKINGARPVRDLFADRPPAQQGARFRDRSASPMRDADGNGRYGFGTNDIDRQKPHAASRRRSPVLRSRGVSSGSDNYGVRDSLRTELFSGKRKRPDTVLADDYANGLSASNQPARRPKELFPQRASPTRTVSSAGGGNGNIELFPERNSQHRRHDAQDLHPDEVADAIGRPTDHPPRARPRELFPSSTTNKPSSSNRNAGVDLFASKNKSNSTRPLRQRASSFDSIVDTTSHHSSSTSRHRNESNGTLGFSIKGASDGRLGYDDEDNYGGGDEGGYSFVGASSSGSGRRGPAAASGGGKGASGGAKGGDLFGDRRGIRGKAGRAA